MLMGKLNRAMLIVCTLFVSCALVPAASAAPAVIEDFSITFSEGPIEVNDTCAGEEVVGTLTGSGILSGRIVETTSTGHHIGNITFDYRVDFADGSYLLASQSERIRFNESPARSQFTFGGVLLEKGTIYDATGQVTGHEMFHHRFRLVLRDGNPIVDFDEGFITCRSTGG